MNALTRRWLAIPAALSVKGFPARLERGVVSLVIEGGAKAFHSGPAPLLERHGVRATLCLDGLGDGTADVPALQDLYEQGHELGLLEPQQGGESFSCALARAGASLQDAIGARAASLAWRSGAFSPRVKAQAARRFAAICGRRRGVNHGVIDLADLRCAPLDDPELRVAASHAARRGGWLVVRAHVGEASGALLANALEVLAAEGLEVRPLKHAAAHAVFGG